MAIPTPTSQAPPIPSAEEISELLLCARYGDPTDLADMQAFVEKYGPHWLAEARDDRGNTCLHMAGGNGHLDIVSYLLPLLPPSSLFTPNHALSTPLHWTSLNFHLPILRLLCPLLPASAFLLLNNRGKTALEITEEACENYLPEVGSEEKEKEREKERIRREVVVGYLLGCMGLGVRTATAKEEEMVEAEEEPEVDGNEEGEGESAEGKEVRERLEKEAERLGALKIAEGEQAKPEEG